MAVLTQCPGCQRRWPIDEPQVGQPVRCPGCDAESTGTNIGRPPGVRRHRVWIAFALGTLALAVFGIFGPFAWWIGASDLRRMQRGEMDPAGMDMARKAVLLGKIGTAKFAVEILLIGGVVAAIVAFAIYAEDMGWSVPFAN
ncbi:MAG: hypothetical protein U0800_20370 [Isosphaeraceae bacterium]